MFKKWNLSGWMVSIIKDIVYLTVVIFLVSLSFGILKRIISTATTKPATSKIIVAAAMATEREWWEGDQQENTEV